MHAILRNGTDAQLKGRHEIRATREGDGSTGFEQPGVNGPVIDRNIFRAGQAVAGIEPAVGAEQTWG
ncbi:MAG: hypothetical protein F9K19_09670 [Rhizobiaceae bacterium]|uniref:hypothetical protein n=1 Tax=Mesorhizobium sp. BE184 TaxID=2817714 RepID=UPI0013A88E47|nr:hypothetical protein [Mesorhizobium sp. BE184]KAB2955960.1 MAG: hypothetical protein F9K19_09670 [Rhizobiaceae bacterium]MDR7032979.1 hypothetical protein [Mesorhizobium sp. BE184]CAG1015349.1 hypothetical protein RHIZO_05041 [Rhizobiaceae bacterium]